VRAVQDSWILFAWNAHKPSELAIEENKQFSQLLQCGEQGEELAAAGSAFTAPHAMAAESDCLLLPLARKNQLEENSSKEK
jgi:hypothetical protein